VIFNLEPVNGQDWATMEKQGGQIDIKLNKYVGATIVIK